MFYLIKFLRLPFYLFVTKVEFCISILTRFYQADFLKFSTLKYEDIIVCSSAKMFVFPKVISDTILEISNLSIFV